MNIFLRRTPVKYCRLQEVCHILFDEFLSTRSLDESVKSVNLWYSSQVSTGRVGKFLEILQFSVSAFSRIFLVLVSFDLQTR